MDYIVRPLAFPQINWKDFNLVCMDTLGYSPTRVIDRMDKGTDKPDAFIHCASLDNSGRIDEGILEHSHFSFIATMNSAMLVQVYGTNVLKIINKESEEERDCYVAIITGSLADWQRAIYILSRKASRKDTRYFANECMRYFEVAGFSLWTSKRQQLMDNTIILS